VGSISSGDHNPLDLDLILQAAQFALQAHAGQVRKIGGQPYFFHPLAVGRMLLEAGMEAEVVAAGILHDTVEDTRTSLDEIEARFGGRVASWVAAVTEPDKSKPWQDRKQAYLDALASADIEVVMISLADKRDNLRSLSMAIESLGADVWDKFTKPKPDQRWYYQKLLALYSDRVEERSGRILLEGLRHDFEGVFDQ
jgi:(p)ppGpp synthase/HD superfamily hydrolase